jgi:hypothetical protein
MTSQNVIFLVAVVALGVVCLFHLNFILNHLPLTLGALLAMAFAAYELGRRGIVDWEEWIPRSRE